MAQLTDRGTVEHRVGDRRLWLRWGTAVLTADLVVHNTAGVLVNDWEGWGVVAQTFVFVLVTGLVIVGVTFGLVVRPALRATRIAGAGLGMGLASLAAYALFFTWAPVLIAPAALLLGREGWRRARTPQERRLPAIGAALGVVSLAVFASFFIFMVFTGHYPLGL